MNITVEKYQLAIDQLADPSRFWVTLKDEQGKSKVINVDCFDTVKHIWKINEHNELFRAIYPLLKEKIKEKMNKGIRTVDNLPDFTFSAINIPKYPPNEALSLPDSFSLSGSKTNQPLRENLTKNNSPLILEPNFYGIGLKLNRVIPWIKKKFKHITKR